VTDDFDERDRKSENRLRSDEPENAATRHALRNDLFAEIALVYLAVARIDAAPRRVRRAVEKQIDAVVRAIETFGFRVPILVRKAPGGDRYEVVDGHIRLEAARRLGAEKLPCILVDGLSKTDVRRLTLSLNKLQETGDWDADLLKLEINEIIDLTDDLEIPGFEIAELEGVRFGVGEPDAKDPADSFGDLIGDDRPPVSCHGDIWMLGEHRLLCGSARDRNAIAVLLDGEIADVIFADAPYNLPISGHVSTVNGKHSEFAEASGEMSQEDFTAFLVDTLGNAVHCLKPGGILFGCMDWRHAIEMSDTFNALRLKLLNVCVWIKDAAGMGGLYRSQHEFVFVGLRPGDRPLNNVQLGKYGRNRSNVWRYAGATGGGRESEDDFTAHPTVKPIRMVMDAILDVSAPGEVVLDPFLGSGTTLLASERTKRRGVGIEIEPRYVDLAIRRWQEMTGGLAVHVETGLTFVELAASRDMDTRLPPDAATVAGQDDGEGADD
jgi:DNA modification methylase